MLDTILRSYVETALWSSTSFAHDDEPMDDHYDADDVSFGSMENMREDVQNFLDLLAEQGVEWQGAMSPEQFGHDFWLTRNGHGAGFWDRGLGELGDALTKWAKSMGSADLWDGEDGRVYYQA